MPTENPMIIFLFKIASKNFAVMYYLNEYQLIFLLDAVDVSFA